MKLLHERAICTLKSTRKTAITSFMLLICIMVVSVSAFSVSVTSALAADASLANGLQFCDTDGNIIHAHGGGLLYYGGYYYWYGECRDGWLFNSVRCYRSADLVNWEYRGAILTKDSAPELNSCNIERPKVVYNAANDTFVMWAHWENGEHYGEAKCCVAYGNTPDGNFTYVGSFRPLEDSVVSKHDGLPGYMSRDCTLFVDDDGTGYFISAANENADLHVYKLTPDYLDIESLQIVLFEGLKREAPCLFKRNGYYFMLTSGCTGWDPNQAKYSYATSITGTWSNLINIGNSTTYNSQPTYVQPIQGTSGTSYLYMGDRWAGAWDGEVMHSRYVWMPLTFNSDTDMQMNYYDAIAIDAEAGTIGPSGTIKVINDSVTGTSNEQFEYVGSWSSGSEEGAHNNDNHWEGDTDGYYQVKFYGTQVKVYGAVAPNHGIAAVSIDGGSETLVDFYQDVRQEVVCVYQSPVLPLGQHTLKVRVTGTKNANSSNVYIPADRVDVYGDTSAELLADDFSGDLSQWTAISNCGIESGELSLNNSGYIESVGGSSWTDYTIECDVNIKEVAAGINFRVSDSDNFYMWQINSSSGELRPHKRVNGSWTVIKEVPYTFNLGTTYHIKISVSGSTISTYVNGNLIDTTTDSTFARGRIGFRQGRYEHAHVDNIYVY